MKRYLVAFLCYVLGLSAFAQESRNCVVVDRVENLQGAVTVWLRNSCGEAILAVSLITGGPGIRDDALTEIDFTVGIGLPEAWAAAIPGGRTSVGLFAPGTLREATLAVVRTAATPEITVGGSITASGAELGNAPSSLLQMKQTWRYRLAELQGLKRHLDSMRRIPRTAVDELECVEYLRDRIQTLQRERRTPGLTSLETRERAGGEMELTLIQQIVANLRVGVERGSVSRSVAGSLVRESVDSRLRGYAAFVEMLRSKRDVER